MQLKYSQVQMLKTSFVLSEVFFSRCKMLTGHFESIPDRISLEKPKGVSYSESIDNFIKV